MLRIERAFGVLWKGIEWLSNQAAWIAGGFTVIITLSIAREVIGRYFFKSPSDWSLELSCYLLVGLTYLSSPYTELVEGHIRVDLIYSRLKGKFKYIADIIISLVGMSWAIVLMWQGARIAFHSLTTNAHSSGAMMWPLFPSQVMIPVGSFFLCLVLAGKAGKGFAKLIKKE